MIEITVRSVSTLKTKFRTPAVVSLPEGSMVKDLLAACGVETDRVIVLLNNMQVSLNHKLNHSDQVTILPIIIGG
ncbi:putative ThiS family [anaerobic digester metagenome]|uniref:Putative ThiS family n=1 Tax=anaerobic digester metagenome TaxID=1263854 RepID=A0A485M1V7_9ZZZZ